jgi:hypothetical protein
MGHAPGTRISGTCPWCGADLFERGTLRYSVIRCKSCATAITWPVPTEAELDAAYGEWYRPHDGRFSGPGDRILKWSRSTLARHLDRSAPPGDILDVGAGDGTLVAALRARGRQALGLERHSCGPHVRNGLVGDISGEWSGVVFWHSLEHLREPAKALTDAAALLRSGGLLVVAVPNYASLQAKIFSDRWFHLDLPRHLVHLDGSRLSAHLGELGLIVTRRSDVRGGQEFFGWLDGLVALFPGQLDLYASIRRPAARGEAVSRRQVAGALAAAFYMAPVALVATVVEVARRRGGTVYLEARKQSSSDDAGQTFAGPSACRDGWDTTTLAHQGSPEGTPNGVLPPNRGVFRRSGAFRRSCARLRQAVGGHLANTRRR